MPEDVSNTFKFNSNQHCTYEYQNGRDDYSFSHKAGYCGKPQPRYCGCAFCYTQEPEHQTLIERLRSIVVYAGDEQAIDEAIEILEGLE